MSTVQCPQCQASFAWNPELAGQVVNCPQCNQPFAFPNQPGSYSIDQDPALRMVLPVGRSALAIAAGYLGLFSLFICFVGPISLIVGILAVRDLRKHPDKHGMGRAVFGIVGGAIGTLVLLVWVVAMAVAAVKQG